MRHRVVETDPDRKGFLVLERRRVAEQTFGWLIRHPGDPFGMADVAFAQAPRGLGRDRERAGRLACVASLMLANALDNPA